jgi:hypothetical protein
MMRCGLIVIGLFVHLASSAAGSLEDVSPKGSTNEGSSADEVLSEFVRKYEHLLDKEGSARPSGTNSKEAAEEGSKSASDQPSKLRFVEVRDPFMEDLNKRTAISIAKTLRNFSGFRKQPLSGVVTAKDEEVADEDTNDYLIREWITNYAGEFTDYVWRAEPIDKQTQLVFCEVSLDGQKHDFKFKVNHELWTCRYEGGTAYEKLRSNQKKKSWLPW